MHELKLVTLMRMHAEPLAQHAVQDPGDVPHDTTERGLTECTSSSSSREVINTWIYVPVVAVPAAAKNRSVQ